MNFDHIKGAVAAQFDHMQRGELHCVDVTGDELWDLYLQSFPEGTNPVYRQRREHDCSCCRHFVRQVGGVVSINDDLTLTSIWDCDEELPPDSPYRLVTSALSALVRSRPIVDRFLTELSAIGTDKNYEVTSGAKGSTTKTWTHFRVDLKHGSNEGVSHLCPAAELDARRGGLRTKHTVSLRSLSEIKLGAAEDVLGLVEENNLYRGAEYASGLRGFVALKQEFDQLPEEASAANFVWRHLHDPGATIRANVVGTLLVDLSDGVPLEDAVRSFEAKVAPDNFRRSKSVVGQRAVDAARKDVEALGLSTSMIRRHATIRDVAIGDVIWADREARAEMRDAFSGVATPKKQLRGDVSGAATITVQGFVDHVLPRAKTVELLLENRLVPNLVSVTAPAHELAPPLFRWHNGFAWDYEGGNADSMIRERVKRAGGNVEGDLRCSLSWRNFDDLDLHLVEESTRFEISFYNKGPSPSGGRLDVDMNAGRGTTREPVENIVYADRTKMHDGYYHLYVHQYHQRELTDVGFEVEVEYAGETRKFLHPLPVRQGQRVSVARLRYTSRRGLEFVQTLEPGQEVSRDAWGLRTGQYHRVSATMYSPNYWGGQRAGNRHYFFVLAGCLRPDDNDARGFFNEYLREELQRHRKVLEIVASRTKIPWSSEQLAGVGFSDTKRVEFAVRVDGRPMRVTV